MTEKAASRSAPRAELGSISTATMRTEDLIPCFTAEIERLDHIHDYQRLIEEAEAITPAQFASEDVESVEVWSVV